MKKEGEEQTERDEKIGLDKEDEIERKRGKNIKSGSGDPVQSLLVCVWGGAAVKSIEARGWGKEGRVK